MLESESQDVNQLILPEKCFEFSPRRAVLYMRTMGLWPTKELFSYKIYGRHHKYEDIVR